MTVAELEHQLASIPSAHGAPVFTRNRMGRIIPVTGIRVVVGAEGDVAVHLNGEDE